MTAKNPRRALGSISRRAFLARSSAALAAASPAAALLTTMTTAPPVSLPDAGYLTDRSGVRIVILGCGSGYTSRPTISFSGGNGSGATATATINGGRNPT